MRPPTPHKWRLALTLLTLAIGASAGCDRMGRAPDINEIQAALEAGDPNLAQVLISQARQKDPDGASAELMIELANSQFQLGQLDEALVSIASAHAAGAASTQIDKLGIQIGLEQGRFSDVLGMIGDPSLELSGDDRSLLRARAFVGMGMIPEAFEVLGGLSEAARQGPDADLVAAEAHMFFDRRDLARASLQRARAIQPDNPRASLLAGLLEMRDRNFRNALREFQNVSTNAGNEFSGRERTLALMSEMDLSLRAPSLGEAKAAHDRLAAFLPLSPLSEMLGAELSIAQGNTSEALTRLEKLVSQHPDFTPARAKLVAALIQDGKTNRASQELGRMSGDAEYSTRAAAVAEALKAASTAPAGFQQQLALAQALMMLEQPLAARRVLERQQTAGGAPHQLEIALVQLLIASDQLEEALERATALALRVPDEPATHIALGRAGEALGRYDMAALGYEAAWKLKPDATTAVGLAVARSRTGASDPEQSLQAWLQQHPNDLTVRLVLADVQARGGNVAAAIGIYQEVLEAQPRNPFALNQLALLYQRTNDSRALETAAKAHDALPERPEILDTYGWILASTGKADQAVPLLESALARGLVKPEIRYHYAKALIARNSPGDRARARSWLQDLRHDAAEGTELRKSTEESLSAIG